MMFTSLQRGVARGGTRGGVWGLPNESSMDGSQGAQRRGNLAAQSAVQHKLIHTGLEDMRSVGKSHVGREG
eukprot:CAMPEP_0202046234 /NCGR_PEP_ID=MMETSP0963-20130614/1176_1 /ASSEMBLY_ACC=CAM_ASM_000494 /TAXON_ID=4773 /ORGANISM="Schizochytrium aggregatum, Strain ATCC28209" /LENGTH=70 /DNA_ID=CAMNT_0048610869 /DNA_START=97 /DNA_END=309 /DNA_ORIENTATION=-